MADLLADSHDRLPVPDDNTLTVPANVVAPVQRRASGRISECRFRKAGAFAGSHPMHAVRDVVHCYPLGERAIIKDDSASAREAVS